MSLFQLKAIVVIIIFLICLVEGVSQQTRAETLAPEIVELFRYGRVIKNARTYEVGERSGVFLKILSKKGDRCLKFNQPGSYSLDQVKKEITQSKSVFDFFNCNLQALVLRLKSPSQMIMVPEPRGEGDDLPDAQQVFDDIWKQVVRGKSVSISAENMLASAIWYSGKGNNMARSSYILKQAYKQHRNKWFLKLHQDAYAKTSPAIIDQEIKKTQTELENLYHPDNNIALLIGIQNYGKQSGWPDLKTPINDIEQLQQTLIQDYHFNSSNIVSLKNATYQEILDALFMLRERITPQTNFLLYYAGHGLVDEDGEYFWIPSDGIQSPRSWIYTDYILKKVKNLNSLHTLLIVDSCFSGALNEFESRGVANEAANKLYLKTSRQLITSGGKEPVADGGGVGNSVFAGSFLDILQNQPEDQPLSTQELFSKLQPSVVVKSNQTPTLDRIPNSQDKWGQYYFIKKPGALTAQLNAKPTNEGKTKPTFEDLPADLVDGLDIPDAKTSNNRGAGLSLHRSETSINAGDILESEDVTLMGVKLYFKILYHQSPVLIQLSYMTAVKEENETLQYLQKVYEIPREVYRLDFQAGARIIRNGEDKAWYTERGLYYYWKRLHIKWDTGHLSVKKTDSEFINIGYNFLNFQNYTAWKPKPYLCLGFNYDAYIGLVSISGSTQVARDEKYNKDVSDFVTGFNLGPEARLSLPVVYLDMRVGVAYEYIWQPMDSEGGSQASDNNINTSQKDSKLYFTFGLGF